MKIGKDAAGSKAINDGDDETWESFWGQSFDHGAYVKEIVKFCNDEVDVSRKGEYS
jgi:hypothetical protein